MTATTIIDLCARRRLLHARLRGMASNPNWQAQLRAELREVEVLILQADCRRLDELRERLTPCGDDAIRRFVAPPVADADGPDVYQRPFAREGRA